jgi:probable rRNA maturation factor
MIPADWELLIANRQRTRRLNTAMIRELAEWIVAGLEHVELGFHFVGAKEIARVHEEFMDIPGSTDVITFDHGSEPPTRIHGEIFICVEDAIAQAKEFKTTWQSEVARYMIHGVLHLKGFDDFYPEDRKVMKRAENRLLAQAAKQFDFRELEKV